MQATELPLAYSQWLLNRSNRFGDWPTANFIFTTDLFYSSGISGKRGVSAFSPCVSESPSPGAKFVAEATVVCPRPPLPVSGLLPDPACRPAAGFLGVRAHVRGSKGPAGPGWSGPGPQLVQPPPGLMLGSVEAALTTWSRNGEHR